MVHKSVLKVDISCEKCKKEVFGIVSKLEGVNKIEADMEKGTIAVIGVVDPYDVIMRLRKAGKKASFVSVGPPPKPEEKKEEDKKAQEKCKEILKMCHNQYQYQCPCGPYPGGCWACKPIAVMTMDYQDPNPPCSIM